LVGDTIHILHEVSESARYHAFRTSDHPTHPDTWAAGGELVAEVEPVAQSAALVVRSDGSMVAFYVGPTKIHYNVRSPAGQWGRDAVIDASVPPNIAHPQAVLGANDTIHLAYYGTDGTIWYRRLLPNGTFTERQQLATGAGTSRGRYTARCCRSSTFPKQTRWSSSTGLRPEGSGSGASYGRVPRQRR
jgi:hypothetical protein